MENMKVGEIREWDGNHYLCASDDTMTCAKCSLTSDKCQFARVKLGHCLPHKRDDGKHVVFIEVKITLLGCIGGKKDD
ncbi:MAG: hypothetical protein WCR70_03815 [Sphaerochaetaceae bacterium]